MLIIHGTQVKRESLGRVADWCPTCRQIQVLQVTRVGKYQHVYFVPVSKTQHVCDELACGVCKKTRQVTRAEYPGFVDAASRLSLEEIIRHTNPGAPARYRARMERDQRIESGEASDEDRQAALEEAFDMAAEQCELIRARKEMGVAGAFAILGIIGVFVGIVVVLATPKFGPGPMDWVLAGGVGALLIPLGFVIVGEGPRRCRARVLPEFADRIWMLAPTREQLEPLIGTHREAKSMLGKAFTVDLVLAAMVKSAERWEKKGALRENDQA